VKGWTILAVLLGASAAALAGAPGAASQSSPDCLGEPPGAMVARLPGPPMRFGITPGAVAGQVGMPASAKPEDQNATLSALGHLAPAGAPFVLRLHRFFWSDGEAGIERFLALAHRYTVRGFQVELQLRYHPASGQEGDIPGWVAFVREAVRRFGSDPGVVGVQVTNEVNFTASQDSSDGAYRGARDALVQGVIAAHDEADRDGYRQLRVGFNWFYRTDPADEQSFWTYLKTSGGPAFAAAVDWVGLDVYPGTFFPPLDTPGGERDAIVNALSSLRCYMGVAGLGAPTPIYVEENGWPTSPSRSEAMQRTVLQTMVSAFDDFRGTYNVSDYRWFDLRDADSSSPNFQQQFGLLHDDYSPKAAFDAYRDLVDRLSIRLAPTPARPGGQPPGRHRRRHGHRIALRLSFRRGRGCARGPVVASLSGRPAGRPVRVRYRVNGRPAGTARRAPYRLRLPADLLPSGRRLVSAVVLGRGTPHLTLRARLRMCPRTGSR